MARRAQHLRCSQPIQPVATGHARMVREALCERSERADNRLDNLRMGSDVFFDDDSKSPNMTKV